MTVKKEFFNKYNAFRMMHLCNIYIYIYILNTFFPVVLQEIEFSHIII